jgi:hypothetical protein
VGEIGEITGEEAKKHGDHVDGNSMDLCGGGEAEVLEYRGCEGCCGASGDVACECR